MYQSSHNLGDLIDTNKDLSHTAVFDGQRYTYKDLLDLSCSFAQGLKNKGAGPGTPVALIMPNSINFVAAYLGILRLGAVAVLVSVKLPSATVDYILNDSQASTVITKDNYREYLALAGHVDFARVNDADPAVILYTSGSTGNPKGVVLAHKHKWYISERYKLNPEPYRILISSPFYHMNGLRHLEQALIAHSSIFLLPEFDARLAIELIGTHRIPSIACVPTVMAMILAETEQLEKFDMDCLKNIYASSAPMSMSLHKKINDHLPTAKVHMNYGITEVGPGLFKNHPRLPTPIGSVGCAISGIDYRIVDGVLQIRSPAMMSGYTSTDFSKSVTKDGYYITNDLFRVDHNGFYYFMGRADDMFVCGGNNIYPSQIESVLEEHPLVESAAVIGLEDDVKGHKPYAFVVSGCAEQELKDHVLKHLPPGHCPRRIWATDSMPLNSVNKIDKVRLRERAREMLNDI